MNSSMEKRMVILALFEIDGFGDLRKQLSPEDLWLVLNHYLEVLGNLLRKSGGTFVKSMGDAALVYYPSENPRSVLRILSDLQPQLETILATSGREVSLTLKIHLGKVLIGALGPVAEKHVDILGPAVEELFSLAGKGILLSEAMAAALVDGSGKEQRNTIREKE